jgi:hypothetical protein
MVHQLEPGGAATELSGGSEVDCGAKDREPEKGAPGESDGLRVTPGVATVSLLGAVRLATSTTIITKIPVAMKIFTMPDLSGEGAELLRFVEAVELVACDELAEFVEFVAFVELAEFAELPEVADFVELVELADFAELVPLADFVELADAALPSTYRAASLAPCLSN